MKSDPDVVDIHGTRLLCTRKTTTLPEIIDQADFGAI
jgi:hypothetical protein